jgi:pentapeptide MXKDX repeat protein
MSGPANQAINPEIFNRRSVFMKKTLVKLMSTVMLFGALAFAQSGDAMKQDNIKNDQMKEDKKAGDTMKKDFAETNSSRHQPVAHPGEGKRAQRSHRRQFEQLTATLPFEFLVFESSDHVLPSIAARLESRP